MYNIFKEFLFFEDIEKKSAQFSIQYFINLNFK